MTQRDFERQLASATGESLGVIRQRGFQLVEPPDPEPLVLDWDVVYPTEAPRRMQRAPKRLKLAA